MSREESGQHFLDLIKYSRRRKFKVYIGMNAGVGKSYRMLQEAHELLDNGVDVKIGYIEDVYKRQVWYMRSFWHIFGTFLADKNM